MKRLISLLFVLTSVSFFSFVNAQHKEHNEHNEHAADDKHHESPSHHHHIAIFNGASTNFKYDVTSYSLGLDYEYYIDNVGIGLFGELIFAEETEFLTGLFASYKIGHIKLMTGPFVEFAKSHDAHATTHDEGFHHKFGVRVGLAYNFHLNKLSIAPGIYTDYIEGGIWVLVYGVGVGFGF